MKKIIFLVLVTALLVACSSPSQSTEQISTSVLESSKIENTETSEPSPTSTEKDVSQKDSPSESKVVTNQKTEADPELEKQIANCTSKGSYSEMSSCLMHLAYYTGDLSQRDQICGEFDSALQDMADCKFVFAMRSRDASQCDEINYDFQPDAQSTYLLDCKKYISYSHNGNTWNLVSGIPPSADPESLSYAGRVTLEGWFVNTSSYVGKPSPHFHVADSSIADLPFGQRYSDFNLLKNDPALVKQLEENSSPTKPIKVVATKIIYIMEGNPLITLTEIAN